MNMSDHVACQSSKDALVWSIVTGQAHAGEWAERLLLGRVCPSEFSRPIFQRLATDSRRIRGRFGTKQTRCRREGKSREGYSPRVFRELSVAALRDFTDAKTRLCAKNGK